MAEVIKQYNTIGCCGIDCGLCPRFHAKGESACPGCGGPNFKEKHPSCGFLTCCAIKHGLEVCTECEEFPCSRFDAERQGYDSFVTHQRVFPNQDAVKQVGICCFLEQQAQRIAMLKDLLAQYDDGRSKGFYCLATALLPIESLEKARTNADQFHSASDVKTKCKALRAELDLIAREMGIELKLRSKV